MAENISTIGSGKTYTTVAAWEAAKQGTITAGDQEVGEVYGVLSVSTTTTIAGWVMGDADSRVMLRAADGEKHTGTTGGAGMTNTASTAVNTLDINNANVGLNMTIEGLDLIADNASYTGKHILISGGTEECQFLVDSCLIHGTNLTTPHHGVDVDSLNNTASRAEVRNSVIYGVYSGVNGLSGATNRTLVNYCTFYNIGEESIIYAVATNCFATDNSLFRDYYLTDAASDYNISSDEWAPGTNVLIDKTTYGDYWTDHANGDFSLKDTTDDGGIFGVTGLAGTPISGITTDIIGTARDGTSPDIGAFEFLAAVVTPVVTNVVADPTNPAKGATFELSADLDTIGETIIAAEWWTGSDLGPGNNNAMDLGAGTTSREATDTVDTTSLALGSNVFWVRGESASGWGDDASVAVSVIVPQPQNVAAVGGDTTVTVTWDDVDYEESYTLFWDTSSPVTIVGSNQITGIAAGSTSYEHTGRTNGVEYFYAVRAIASAAASLLSSEVSAVAGASAGGGGPLGSKFSKFLN